MGVVGDAVFEDEFDVFEVGDFLARIAVDDDEVGVFAGLECADAVSFAEEFGSILRSDVDGFERAEAGFHEQLGLPLIAKTSEHAAIPGRIFTRKKQPSSFDEVALEFHFFLQEGGSGAVTFRNASARSEIVSSRR